MSKEKKITLGIILLIIAGIGFVLVNAYEKREKSHPQRSGKENVFEKKQEHEKLIALTPQQIQKYNIQTLKIDKSDFQQKLTLPGEIILNEDNVIYIVASVPGIVKEVYKNLGEIVKKNEHLVSIQSREMAEAKAGYLAALKEIELKSELYNHEEKLWALKIRSKIEYLKVKTILESAKIQLDQTKQKLLALGITEQEIKALPQDKDPLNLYYIDSPIDGVVIERDLIRGEVIDKNKQIYVLADLSTLWVNLAVGAKDLHKIQKKQKVFISSNIERSQTMSEVMYVGPMINEESRSGRAIVQLDNSKNNWHPGDSVKAEIFISSDTVNLIIPIGAVQKIDGNPFVFVRSKKGFIAKPVVLEDLNNNDFIRVNEGLKIGDEIAVANTFLLKAELEKSEAEHSH